MRKALNPETKVFINVDDYTKEFGNRPLGSQIDFRPKAICPYCKQQMSVVASSSPNSTGHFSHFPDSPFCPSKEISNALYINKFPKNPDSAHGYSPLLSP